MEPPVLLSSSPTETELARVRDYVQSELSVKPEPWDLVQELLDAGTLGTPADRAMVDAAFMECARPPSYVLLDAYLSQRRVLSRSFDLSSMPAPTAEVLSQILELWVLVLGSLGRIKDAEQRAAEALRATAQRTRQQEIWFSLAASSMASITADLPPRRRVRLALRAIRQSEGLGAAAEFCATNRATVHAMAGSWGALPLRRRRKHISAALSVPGTEPATIQQLSSQLEQLPVPRWWEGWI